MDLLLNPVVVSVAVLCVLCVLRLNVLLAMLAASLVAGLAGGLPVSRTMELLTEGFSANATTALSYILLGTFVVGIARTGLMEMLVEVISRHVGTRRGMFCLIVAFISCLSQNVVPVHIAFIPVLIPPLLALMNRMHLDRRAVSCALGFGLTAPYIAIPMGFGLIFQGIVADNMTKNGMPVKVADVTAVAWILFLAMLAGLLFAVFVSYRGQRTYEDRPVLGQAPAERKPFGRVHAVTLAAIVISVVIQIWFDSLPMAALTGIAVMMAGGAIRFQDHEEYVSGGIRMMGYIAFVMLCAGGYAAILKATGCVPKLIESVVPLIGSSRFAAAVLITVIGLLVTMGIGTSFGTIPVLAVIYVPLCSAVGFSVPATVLLITAAGALGDAGSPASDSTLGPTSGLAADGQHDHVRDTCIPTFLHYNLPLMAAAIAGALVL